MPLAELPLEITTGRGHVLRAAAEGDVDRLIELYGQLHSSDFDDREGFAAELAAITAHASRRVYVFEVDAAIVGTIDVFLMRNLTRNLRPWVGVENFVVDTAVRRQGFGREILEAVIATAREVGAYKVQLISSTKRIEAHGLYTSVGFTAPVSGFRTYLTD